MRVTDAAGRLLDATYSAERDGARIALIMESRSGSSSDRTGRNSEYNPALTLLLERLASLNATLVDALVDSRRTQALGIPEADRRLIAAPSLLAQVPDMDEFRVRLGTAQAKVAQEPDATKGGNSTKRVRLLLDVPGYRPDQASLLADFISVPAQELVSPRAIRERLENLVDHEPTEADYASFLSELNGALDELVRTVRRVEQSALRKLLFAGSAAPCDLCGREFEVEFLVAAHVKMRAECDDWEKRDVAHVVMSACRFGCDELYERGYISVAEDGQLLISRDIETSMHAHAYARKYLAGRVFLRPLAGREHYFGWHRAKKFRDKT